MTSFIDAIENSKRPKKALITGCAGQDGSLLAEFLLNKGYIVYGLIKENSNLDNLKEVLSNPYFRSIQGSLLEENLINSILIQYPFDEIYNLASQSNIRLSYEQPRETFEVCLMGTLNLLEAIRIYSPTSKLFQAGSSAMFGESMDFGYQIETTPMRPISPYASSKLFAYNICENYRQNYDLFISNGILYNHESLKTKSRLGLVHKIVKAACEIPKNLEKPDSCMGVDNLAITIDLGHAKDYVEAMWLILQQEKPDNYIISNGETISVEYICSYVFGKLGLDYEDYVIDVESKPLFEARGVASKLKRIGWNPKYKIEDILDELIEYYKNK